MESAADTTWFVQARYGLFVHYGLYSLLGRGEWVLNREGLDLAGYERLAGRFTAERFDAGALCDLAVEAGMRYLTFTTMHHDGFCLYETALTDFNSTRAAARRDLVAEVVEAARARGLRIALYHSLNNWREKPDAVDALEDPAARSEFVDRAHARIRELATRFDPVDTMWYDGWWPFNAEGWRGEAMNAMVRAIQPHILFNGRNGLPGDFATPEGHLGAPRPWRPWEACMTLNNSWGYHAGDRDWKSPAQVAGLLATVAQGRGNLLLNVGPRGDGSVPEPSADVLRRVGRWLKTNGESVFDTDSFTYDLRERGDHRGEWSHHGPLTARGDRLYWLVRQWPGADLVLAGLETRVRRVVLLGGGRELPFEQTGGRVVIRTGAEAPPDEVCPVLRLECEGPPAMYLTGGLRVPRVPHPHYDPCPSDIVH